MKILFLTPYVYHPQLKNFCKNNTGFGMMVDTIARTVSGSDDEVFCLTHVFTKECKDSGIIFLKHTMLDVIRNASITEVVKFLPELRKNDLPLRMKLRQLYYFVDQRFVNRVLLSLKPDIVHIHGLGLTSKYYINACDMLSIPYVVTAHGLIENAPNAYPIDKEFEKEFFLKSDKNHKTVCVISSGIKRRLLEDSYYGLKHENNITVIPNGIDILPAEELINIRSKYNIPDNAKVVLAIGSVCERKNQIQIVRAYSKLPKNLRDDVWIFIIGKISSDYPIQELINKLNVNEHVCLTGFIPHKDLADYYRVSDLVVMASIDEGYGLSLVEGFVYGVPCLAFSDLDAVEDIYNEKVMILCKERTDEALALSMESALNMNWSKEKITDYCKHFSLENMGKRYRTVYETVLGK